MLAGRHLPLGTYVRQVNMAESDFRFVATHQASSLLRQWQETTLRDDMRCRFSQAQERAQTLAVCPCRVDPDSTLLKGGAFLSVYWRC